MSIPQTAPGYASRIAVVYVLAAAAWIVFSDLLLHLLALDEALMPVISSVKGLGFIGVTGAILYMHLRRVFAQRLQVEAALRASEEKYRSLVDSVDAAISLLDVQGRYLYLNEIAARRYGSTTADLTGKTVHEFFPASEADQMLRDVRQVVQQDSGMVLEPELTLDGETHWFRTSIQPVHDGDGKPFAALVHTSDITEQKLVERAMLVQNAILHQSHDLIALGTLDGQIGFINEAGATLLDADEPEIIIGMRAILLHPPEEGERLMQQYMPYAQENGYWRGENRLKTLKGRIVEVDQTLFPIRDERGKIIRMATIIVDITERKRMENALRESELRFRQITKNIREVFYLNDVQKQQILYVSPTYADIWGRDPEALYEGGDLFFDAVHPDDRHRVAESVRQQQEGQQAEVTYRIIRPDHSIRWIRSQAFPVFEDDGTFQRIAGIAEDITERVRYESQLKRLSQRLVTVLDNERIRIARELHDQVGQQLTGLSLSLAVIQAQCAPDHPAVPRLDDATELISTIIERIRLIITDLRPLVLDDMGLAAGLRWYCEKFTRRTTIPVTLNLPETEVSFTPMIANAFYQIAQEALMNVAKHAAATHAWITLEVDPKQLKLTIGDDGRGFDAQTLRDSDYDGCWGLQIMQERTEGIVGSRLSVDSQPGQGTRITVRMQL